MDAPALAATAASASPSGRRAFSPPPKAGAKTDAANGGRAISVVVDYGRDPQTGKWVCPARKRWGLGAHQKMTPELEDRVCLTATLADSYAAAAQLAAKWGSPVEVSTIRAHACQVGQRAAAQAQERRACRSRRGECLPASKWPRLLRW